MVVCIDINGGGYGNGRKDAGGGGWRGWGSGGCKGVVRRKKTGKSHRGKKVGSKDKGFWMPLGGGTYENG